MEKTSREFYTLSKLKYELKKELKEFNPHLYKLELKKSLIINEPPKINSFEKFKPRTPIQILEVKQSNGIMKKIGIIKLSSINIDRKLDSFSKDLDKNTDYVAIDIQKKYSMLNKEYFETHFDPIYLEVYSDPNFKLSNLKSRHDIANINVGQNNISYDKISILSSRKQGMVEGIKEKIFSILNSIEEFPTIEKHMIINKHIKSIDKRLSILELEILNNHSFLGNEFVSKISKNTNIDNTLVNIGSSESMVKKVLNGNAIIAKALFNGDNILESMYEEKIDYKIIEIGSKDSIIEKVNTILNDLERSNKDLEVYVESIIESEFIEESSYDSFENLL